MTREVKSLWGCIIVLFACVIVLAGILILRLDVPVKSPEAASSDSSSVVASVGTHKITRAQWNRELEQQYGGLVLEQMLTNRAADQEAKSLGIEVTSEEVTREIKRQMKGYESEEAYFQAMKEQLGMSPEQLSQDMRNQLLLEKIATYGIDIGDADIDEYMREHKGEYEPVNSYQVAHITVSNKTDAEAILDRIKQGEDFPSLAGELSLDSFSSQQGGRMGWIDEDDPFLDHAELNQVSQMDVGDISPPVKIKDGYAIINLVGKREVRPEQHDEMRERVRKEIALEKTPPLVQWRKALREKYGAAIADTAFTTE
ncbi:SurA N-terminal domain-containing protein [Paenibacillus alvei]|uniref:peptidylprolyl isomerase n=1 Tax=Paenibacillus alvei TaxID=44250 RepID=A0ABT4H2W0_PAEAL|nr:MULTISPECIES: SurA N-terminal domain-containing protein [Paenibacillus]EJW18882.1 peptidyl-prolyl isomerase [Paenibacillus alvei DSM 29]MCY7485476.1 SurA N-terminal domain-containing protein [Paenibacillus alvei]MCY9541153.1 SurA N-terminal domain-containing protein [Paenibacillus alvei]MCY9705421.1 SurA N-terminal domain-containing protein [Paenibacillus alvei]MCY9736915.1 SurA N-terminal domain-containing protein [Paenibacillus alvei]